MNATPAARPTPADVRAAAAKAARDAATRARRAAAAAVCNRGTGPSTARHAGLSSVDFVMPYATRAQQEADAAHTADRHGDPADAAWHARLAMAAAANAAAEAAGKDAAALDAAAQALEAALDACRIEPMPTPPAAAIAAAQAAVVSAWDAVAAARTEAAADAAMDEFAAAASHLENLDPAWAVWSTPHTDARLAAAAAGWRVALEAALDDILTRRARKASITKTPAAMAFAECSAEFHRMEFATTDDERARCFSAWSAACARWDARIEDWANFADVKQGSEIPGHREPAARQKNARLAMSWA